MNEFINKLPKPDVGQLQQHWVRRRNYQIEEITIVEERIDSLLQFRAARYARMYMAIVELLVQNQKHLIVVDQRGDFLLIRPGHFVKVVVAYLRERVLVHVLYVVAGPPYILLSCFICRQFK